MGGWGPEGEGLTERCQGSRWGQGGQRGQGEVSEVVGRSVGSQGGQWGHRAVSGVTGGSVGTQGGQWGHGVSEDKRWSGGSWGTSRAWGQVTLESSTLRPVVVGAAVPKPLPFGDLSTCEDTGARERVAGATAKSEKQSQGAPGP